MLTPGSYSLHMDNGANVETQGICNQRIGFTSLLAIHQTSFLCFLEHAFTTHFLHCSHNILFKYLEIFVFIKKADNFLYFGLLL